MKLKRYVLPVVIALGLLLPLVMASAGNALDLFDLLVVHKDPAHYRRPEAGGAEDISAVQKEAYALLRRDLASLSFAHVDLRVKEALYDGRTLWMMLSIRDKTAKAPFDAWTAEEILNSRFCFEAAEKDGVKWNFFDWVMVNGSRIDSAVWEPVTAAGNENGEILTLAQYDLSNFRAGEALEIRLPVLEADSAGQDGLVFTLPAGNLAGTRHIQPSAPVRFGGYSAAVTAFYLSPVRVYADLEFSFDPGTPLTEAERVVWQWAQKGALADAAGGQVLADLDGSWRYSANVSLSDSGMDSVIDPGKPVQALIRKEYLPLDAYPEAFALSLGDDRVEIPNASMSDPS